MVKSMLDLRLLDSYCPDREEAEPGQEAGLPQEAGLQQEAEQGAEQQVRTMQTLTLKNTWT